MTKSEIQNYINGIISKGYEPEVYALLKINDAYMLKNFLAEESLLTEMKKSVDSMLKEKIFDDDFNVEDASKIEENLKVYYEIIQDQEYKPFDFLKSSITDSYKESDQKNLKGFFLKINFNTKCFWIYQHKYPMTLINKKGSVIAFLNKQNRYEPLNVDVVKFDNKIDLLIINNSIITKNINLLQKEFSFEKFIRTEADKGIKSIESLGIISSTEILKTMAASTKLTTSKKLMNIKNSKTMNLGKEELYNNAKNHSLYKNLFKFDDEKKEIIINSQKDANQF